MFRCLLAGTDSGTITINPTTKLSAWKALWAPSLPDFLFSLDRNSDCECLSQFVESPDHEI